MASPAYPIPHAKLSVCTFLRSEALSHSLEQYLKGDSSSILRNGFTIVQVADSDEFFDFIQNTKPSVDCLILEYHSDLHQLLKQLRDQSILVPTIILEKEQPLEDKPLSASVGEKAPDLSELYHAALLQKPTANLNLIGDYISEAIAKFLKLSTEGQLLITASSSNTLTALSVHSSLMQQQQRLSEKLKERLGYLGVYYKRNPAHFLRHMTLRERQELLEQLRSDYRQIILNYFSNAAILNQKIDSFVNLAFFADVPVAQIVEIHMDLMDEFSKQLKLEGRSDEILLDYRLTLIDTIAHLCEMYRRSIPRES